MYQVKNVSSKIYNKLNLVDLYAFENDVFYVICDLEVT